MTIPSSPEPFGLVVVEGMAAGKPMVATRAGDPLDSITDSYLSCCLGRRLLHQAGQALAGNSSGEDAVGLNG